jgi:type II secretory pathway component GspD/PulD (secretin)
MKKTSLAPIISAMFTTAWLTIATADVANAQAQPEETNAPPDAAATSDQPAPPPDQSTAPQGQPASPPEQLVAAPSNMPVNKQPAPTNGLVFNFHDVPLSAVLTYLSAKAGLIIVSDVNLQGKVSIVAEQPVTTNDIVTLLNDQLGKNNYAAVLQGRTLTIMDQERAKTYALTPIIVPNTYTNLIMDDEIVTAILPLHTLSAPQLVKDLDLLIPRGATVTANEAGNAIIMTGQQKDVRRIDEIINDLDGTALSEVRVSVLKYADAKSVAAELKEIFQSADSDVTRAATRNNFARGGGGGRGGFNPMAMFGGGPGGGGGGNNEGSQNNVSTHAVFVSDDELNAVVSSAPPDYMQMITNVIADLDQPSAEVTVMKVFHLRHADPGEISDELATMFPSTTATTDQNNRTMGMRFMPPFMQPQQSAGNSQSTRMKRETTVMCVPDRRTQSVIVSASKDMMEQIKGVIEDLDQGTQGVQKVTALDLGAADPATAEQTLAGLFSSANNSRNQSSTQTQTPLANRYTGNANSQTTTTQTTGGGSSSLGTGTLH